MERLARHALVAELVRAMGEAGSWCGRTHVQKTLFAFQALFQPEPGLQSPFRLYMHGPYSFQLDDDLTEMEFYGALERDRQPPYGQRYGVRPGAETLRQRFGNGVDRWLLPLRFVAREVATRTARELEALATLIFVATDEREGLRDAAPGQQLAYLRRLKPHLSEAEVNAARAEYQRLLGASRGLTG
jgi:hypothetical protein